ncbi:unnamed protein product [Nesidiocoris tenuis]|uniref:m7GpppN-mRNA hydrolase n=2 Tax=Nesidiocoris tenuis TaxID=355587 RepID=A0A6H5H500_9HEMI|nr:Dcp2, box A domain [Nesidiocoris tenuis]CAB0010502.1 unnamed protein product [Nesidiocoris tenuis]
MAASEGVIPIDVLDDLCSRFIINVPEEERKNVIRICFQIEQAHWFYIDFYSKRKENRRICNLQEFATIVFKHVPFLHPFVERVDEIIGEWKEYKYCVPTYGAILLNEDLSHVLLVQSYCSKSSWGFPKGKINRDELPWQCAIREVLEETGFDIREFMDPTEYVEATINEQTVRLYVVPGISMDTQFTPKTRNEIKSVSWFPLADLPANKKEATSKIKTTSGTLSFFMVIPFIRKLRELIQEKYSQSPRKGRSRRPRNKSCGDLDFMEMKDNPGSEKKKNVKSATKDRDATEGAAGGMFPVRASSALSKPGIAEAADGRSYESGTNARRTLDYLNQASNNMPAARTEEYNQQKKTPKKIRILKKTDSLTEPPDNRSGKNLLDTLFPNKDLLSEGNSARLPVGETKQKTPKKPTALDQQGKQRETLSESPQSKSFGGINHDRCLSSFVRVANTKAAGRNCLLNASTSSGDGQKFADVGSAGFPNAPKHVEFVEISFSKNFEKYGARAWSNFKFDRQAILKAMDG